MKIGPKYKIARKLRAPIFEKTQTQKYSLREEKKTKKRAFRSKTDFGLQLNEKQKARMFYCITEKQFSKYVKSALSKKNTSPAQYLLKLLESRLDNTVWRAGILPTHLSARQAVAHGHFTVNGRRVYTPSFALREGDKISIREGSRDSRLFGELEERMAKMAYPNWIFWDGKAKEISIKNSNFEQSPDLLFDLGQVIEYYQR